MTDESLDSILETLSWLDVDSFWQGSPWLVGKEEFPKKLSKIALPSAGVMCANEPPAVMSSLGQTPCLNPSKRCSMIHYRVYIGPS